MSAAAVAISQLSFSSIPVSHPTRKPKLKTPTSLVVVSCTSSSSEEENRKDFKRKPENQLAKLAVVTLAAGVLTLGSVHDASAAKSGGRVGGQAFRSSAPRSSGPRINNSRTNIYVNPPVAPPLVGGYGFGGVPYYGGWGWSPFSYFAGPSVAVGVGGGFDAFVLFLVLGAVGSVIRRVLRSRDDEIDDD